MGSFYATTCKTDCLQILYKFCKNWISVPNIVHQLTLSLRSKYWKIHSRSNFQNAINSIRRPTSDCDRATAKPMTSVFYDVTRLEAVRDSFNVLIEDHFDGFGGIWITKCCQPSCVPQKGTSLPHNACVLAILRQNPCTGYFSRRVRGEKIKIKIKKRGLIFHVFRQAHPNDRLAQILGYVFVPWT